MCIRDRTSVEKADIKGLTVLAEKATNTVTRAGEQPIIEATIDEIVNGRMTVNLKKLTTESFKGTELSEENNLSLIHILITSIPLTKLVGANVSDVRR